MNGPLRVRRDLREGSHPHSLVYGHPSDETALIALNDHTATEVEAQLAPHTDPRIVDVSESGLPKWPDLTELREIVDALDEVKRAHGNLAAIVSASPLLDAARRLVYPEGDA